ncbi:MAG: GAF domain-containing protein [Chloroflexota bacterium]
MMANFSDTIRISFNKFVTRNLANYPTQTTAEENIMRGYLFMVATAVPLGMISAAFYLTLFLITGVPQILAAMMVMLLIVGSFLPLHFLGRASRFHLVGLIGTGYIAILYSLLELIFSNATGHLVIGGFALIIVFGTLLIPQRRMGWLAIGLLFAALMTLIEYVEPLPRYNIQDSVPLSIFIPTMTALVSVVLLLEVFRNLVSGSVQTRLLIIISIASAVPALAVGIIASTLSQRALTQAAEQALLSAATQTATAVDTFITTNLNITRNDANLLPFIDYLSWPAADRTNSAAEQQARQLLYQLARLDQTYIASYALLDVEGNVLLDTVTSNQGANEANRTYFQETLARGQEYVSDLQVDDSGVGLVFTAPIRTITDEMVVGVLRVRYRVDAIEQIIKENNDLVGEDSTPLLLDEYLLRLVDLRAPILLLEPIAPLSTADLELLRATNRLPLSSNIAAVSLEDFATLLQNTDADPIFTTETHPNEDSPDSVAVAHLTTKPWLVAYHVEQEIFLAPIQTQQRIMFFATIAITLSILGLAIWQSRAFTRPIQELTEAAERITDGDLTTTVPITSQDEIGVLSASFNAMTSQLQELFNTMEQRVQSRTEALTISAEVGRRLTTILDEGELVRAVVQQVRDAFSYYHVHIYLFDKNKETLYMAGGTGEAGRQMLAAGHSITPGRGLVGQAATTGAVVLISDVGQSPDWLPNPLLPDTRAEAAVPIALGEDVLGVLDVQHNLVNGLQDIDTELLSSIANQVAIALRNARLYAEREIQAQRATLINDINQKILNTTDMSTAMQVAVRELGRISQAELVRINLISDTTNGKDNDA